jgi:hypothetical protein
MNRARIVPPDSLPFAVPCSRCSAAHQPWDRIAGTAYCPGCQEAIVLGETPPLIARTERKPCAACERVGTVSYLTFPLNGPGVVAVDLCAEHMRSLLGRRLGPHAYQQLRRQLQTLAVAVEDVFLLHAAFYDTNGRALQPAEEVV